MEFKRSSGILAHPTSFPSKYGIGDLGSSATAFVDFLCKGGQKLWQILPLGPTSYGDSPYQSFSTFAGNPLIISPDILKVEGFLTDEDLENIPCHNEYKIDYGMATVYKDSIYRKAFQRFLQNADKKQLSAFTKFCKENSQWLNDYVLFVSIKNYFITERKNAGETDEYKAFADEAKVFLTEGQIADYYYGAVWVTWPDDIKTRVKKAIADWTEKLKDEVEYQKFLQYEFFKQWGAIKKYANDKEIQIIGDIPIFISYDSSDVWSDPDLFLLDAKGFPVCGAGVPPDYFSETGQLWGNPIYNWAEHKEKDYSWWVKRIASCLSTVDILRIDHFRGFESYWSVPAGEQTAINGKWCKGPGKPLFAKIQAELGELPIIAEDLGVITPPVKKLRDSLKFPGMKVLQFAFESAEANEYIPHSYDSNNYVIYTGTHDNDTTLGWYQNTTEQYKDRTRRYMNVSGNDIAWDFIRTAYASVCNMAIVPIQDVMNLDSSARMNVPGVAYGNWQFRYTSNMLNDNLANGLKYLTELFDR